MRAEPRGDAARVADRSQLGELGVSIEPVARLGLEGRSPGGEHPAAVTLERLAETRLACGPGRADGREDASARGVELLVARTAGAE